MNWVKEIASSLEEEIREENPNSFVDESVFEIDSSRETEESINNQGWGHSLNPAPLWHRNVRHRAWYETLFTEVCIRRQALYLPLPLALFGSKRIEPDGMIIVDGIVELIELDGQSHDLELASTEQQRLKPFRDNLIDVMRFPIPEEVDINWAHGVLDQVFERIEKRKALFGSSI